MFSYNIKIKNDYTQQNTKHTRIDISFVHDTHKANRNTTTDS